MQRRKPLPSRSERSLSKKKAVSRGLAHRLRPCPGCVLPGDQAGLEALPEASLGWLPGWVPSAKWSPGLRSALWPGALASGAHGYKAETPGSTLGAGRPQEPWTEWGEP